MAQQHLSVLAAALDATAFRDTLALSATIVSLFGFSMHSPSRMVHLGPFTFVVCGACGLHLLYLSMQDPEVRSVPAGFDEINTIIVHPKQATVDAMKRGKLQFGVDFDLIVGKDKPMIVGEDEVVAALPYSIANGFLIDISLKGR